MVFWYLPCAIFHQWTGVFFKALGFSFPERKVPDKPPSDAVHGLEAFTPAAAVILEPMNPAERRQSLMRAYFRHTQIRLMERYSLQLTQDVWNGWSSLIREKNSMAIFVERGNGDAEIWRVWFGHRVVYAVFRDDFVVTVLPDEGQFKKAVARAIRERADKEKQKKTVPYTAQPSSAASVKITKAAMPAVAAQKPKVVSKPATVRLTREQADSHAFVAAMNGVAPMSNKSKRVM